MNFNFALEETVKDQPTDKARFGGYLFGSGQEVQIQVNHTAVHAGPIFLNLLYNYLLKADDKDGTISLGFHPLPLTAVEKEFLLNFQSFVITFNIMISFAFVSSFALTFVVMEKEIEIKAQQFVNGVSIAYYWISNWIYDASMYIIPICSMLIILTVYKVDILIGPESLGIIYYLF